MPALPCPSGRVSMVAMGIGPTWPRPTGADDQAMREPSMPSKVVLSTSWLGASVRTVPPTESRSSGLTASQPSEPVSSRTGRLPSPTGSSTSGEGETAEARAKSKRSAPSRPGSSAGRGGDGDRARGRIELPGAGLHEAGADEAGLGQAVEGVAGLDGAHDRTHIAELGPADRELGQRHDLTAEDLAVHGGGGDGPGRAAAEDLRDLLGHDRRVRRYRGSWARCGCRRRG